MLRNTADSYGLMTRSLHWLLAAAMFSLIGLGWYLVEAGYYDPLYLAMLGWHQSVGVVVWFLAVWMLGWHHLSRPPGAVVGLHAFERVASRIVKIALYAALLLIPLSGYLMSAAEDGPVEVFDRVPLPPLPDNLRPYADPALSFHVHASYLTLGVAVLHAAGALKHHFVDRNAVLRRMITQHLP